jgi:hypothetical protein
MCACARAFPSLLVQTIYVIGDVVHFSPERNAGLLSRALKKRRTLATWTNVNAGNNHVPAMKTQPDVRGNKGITVSACVLSYC